MRRAVKQEKGAAAPIVMRGISHDLMCIMLGAIRPLPCNSDRAIITPSLPATTDAIHQRLVGGVWRRRRARLVQRSRQRPLSIAQRRRPCDRATFGPCAGAASRPGRVVSLSRSGIPCVLDFAMASFGVVQVLAFGRWLNASTERFGSPPRATRSYHAPQRVSRRSRGFLQLERRVLLWSCPVPVTQRRESAPYVEFDVSVAMPRPSVAEEGCRRHVLRPHYGRRNGFASAMAAVELLPGKLESSACIKSPVMGGGIDRTSQSPVVSCPA